ncbi:hypothetical protein BSKO_02002 [Bryopsis sp. KO-2023]|nr:hypothetical protein BSKO_02002 [Bryopsis sp. KO-2023]
MFGPNCFRELGRAQVLGSSYVVRCEGTRFGRKGSVSGQSCTRSKIFGATSRKRKPHRCVSGKDSAPGTSLGLDETTNLTEEVPNNNGESNSAEARADSANGASPSTQEKEKEEVDAAAAWAAVIPERVRYQLAHNPSVAIVKRCGSLLKENLWSILSLTILNSAARFGLCWALYKTVSLVAVAFFGVPASSIPEEMLPAMGTEGDSAVYSQLADVTFLLFKPLDFLVKGLFLGAVLLACSDKTVLGKEEDRPISTENGSEVAGTSEGEKPKSRWGFVKEIWGGFCRAAVSLWLSIKSSPRLIVVHVIVGVLTAICQGLCLLIIPFLFAIRRLLNLQLALFSSVIDGLPGKAALLRSKELVEPIRPMLYLPYILLFVSPKFLGALRDYLLRVLPERLFTDVPELSWGLVVVISVTSFLIDRMHDILPVVVYAAALNPPKKEASE